MTIPCSPTAPTDPVTGTMWADTTTNRAHVFDGSQWILVLGQTSKLPETWQEWFDYYINASGNIPDQYTKQVYIQQEMQGRFPGKYQVDLAGHDWVMVFATPADETWWHLKYD